MAEDFIDISTPLKHLSEASIVPMGKCVLSFIHVPSSISYLHVFTFNVVVYNVPLI